jgi:hypothetical protein
MANPLDLALSEFSADDKTPRLVSAIFSVIPGAPEYRHVRSVKELLQHLRIDPTPATLNRVQGAASGDRVTDALWMAGALDTGDKGYAVVTGVTSAVKAFFGGKKALDNDNAQRNDAVVKALGLAYIVHKAVPGSLSEKATSFGNLEAGRMMATWYGAVEIALPFSDNLAQSGAGFLDKLFKANGTGAAMRLSGMAGSRSLSGAREMLESLTGTLQNSVNRAQDKAPALADAARKVIPAAAVGVDVGAGLAAQAADLMPVYRLLGARLVAEATIREALG